MDPPIIQHNCFSLQCTTETLFCIATNYIQQLLALVLIDSLITSAQTTTKLYAIVINISNPAQITGTDCGRLISGQIQPDLLLPL